MLLIDKSIPIHTHQMMSSFIHNNGNNIVQYSLWLLYRWKNINLLEKLCITELLVIRYIVKHQIGIPEIYLTRETSQCVSYRLRLSKHC